MVNNRKNKVRAYVPKDFVSNLERIFPMQRSIYKKCKELNKSFEKFLNDNRASIQDIFYIVIGFFVVAVCLLFVFKLVSSANTNMQGMDVLTDEAKSMSSSITTFIPQSFDVGMLILFIGMMIAMLILAMLVPVHPVFMVFYLIILVIGVVFGGFLSNFYESIATNEALAVEASQFYWMGLIFRYLPMLMGVFGLVLMVVMYKVYGGSQNG